MRNFSKCFVLLPWLLARNSIVAFRKYQNVYLITFVGALNLHCTQMPIWSAERFFFIRLLRIVIRDLFDFGNPKCSLNASERFAKTLHYPVKQMNKTHDVRTQTNRFYLEFVIFSIRTDISIHFGLNRLKCLTIVPFLFLFRKLSWFAMVLLNCIHVEWNYRFLLNSIQVKFQRRKNVWRKKNRIVNISIALSFDSFC